MSRSVDNVGVDGDKTPGSGVRRVDGASTHSASDGRGRHLHR